MYTRKHGVSLVLTNTPVPLTCPRVWCYSPKDICYCLLVRTTITSSVELRILCKNLLASVLDTHLSCSPLLTWFIFLLVCLFVGLLPLRYLAEDSKGCYLTIWISLDLQILGNVSFTKMEILMAGRTVSSHPKKSISAARRTVLCDLSKNLQENWKMYKRYTQAKRGCYVLDFLGHSQDISGLSNQHSRAPLIQATSGGRGAMSSSYWSNLP